jgi:methylated-DNA-[protein]-cysteine S-methyltransferase
MTNASFPNLQPVAQHTKAPHTLAIQSPWGWWALDSSEDHILALDYLGQSKPDHLKTEAETRLEQRLDCMFSRYFRGEPVDFSHVPVDFSRLTPFQSEVLTLLRTVPYGEVRSYQWLADALGKPKASRAVGGALGSNPWPILLPCHRVISKTGSLGGFMRSAEAGPWLKSSLLALEGVVWPDRKPVSQLKALSV